MTKNHLNGVITIAFVLAALSLIVAGVAAVWQAEFWVKMGFSSVVIFGGIFFATMVLVSVVKDDRLGS